MIRVYFERGYTSEEVAMFHDEETYMACLPSLEELARKQNWKQVTESIECLGVKYFYERAENDNGR